MGSRFAPNTSCIQVRSGMVSARPLVPRLPRGDGHPVLVLPGLLADDISTRALRVVLRRLGYDVHGWGLGRNIGPTAACVKCMRDKIDYLNDEHGVPVAAGQSGDQRAGGQVQAVVRHRPSRLAEVQRERGPVVLPYCHFVLLLPTTVGTDVYQDGTWLTRRPGEAQAEVAQMCSAPYQPFTSHD